MGGYNMDYFLVVLIISSFAMGFWASHFLTRSARVRSARKAAKTRKINKLTKEQGIG